MRLSSKCEKSYVVDPMVPACRTVFLVVEDKKQDAVYIDVDAEDSESELILECLESHSRPFLIPHGAA